MDFREPGFHFTFTPTLIELFTFQGHVKKAKNFDQPKHDWPKSTFLSVF